MNKEIEKLEYMNQTLLLLLGYGSAFVMSCKDHICINELETKKYKWFFKSIENLVYLNKPLPLAP